MNGLRVITPILMSHAPLDTVTIMLGTNDSKERFGCNSYLISQGIVRLVKKALHTECWRDNARAGRARHRSAVHHAGVRPPDF